MMESFLIDCKVKKIKESTISQYRYDLRMILIYIYDNLSNKKVQDISKKDFRQMSLWMTTELGVSNSRINRLFSCCRSFWNFIEAEEDYDYNFNYITKVKGVPKDKVREIYFVKDEEVIQLLSKLEKEERYQEAAIIAILYETGARRGEAVQINKYSFLEEDKTVTNVLVGKRGKKYKAVYHSLSKKYAKLWLGQRGDDEEPALFITHDGERLSGAGLYMIVKGLREDLHEITGKYQEVNPHSFRHSYINNCLDGTHEICKDYHLDKIPIDKLKILVNHENIDMTASYAQNKDKEEIEKFFNIQYD